MIGMYQGVEFIVGTAEVVSANIRNEVGFDVVAMNRRGYRVYLKSFIITDFKGVTFRSYRFDITDLMESIDKKEAEAKNWASRFNMK